MEKIKIEFSVCEPTVDGTNLNNKESLERFLDAIKRGLSTTVTFKSDWAKRPFAIITVWKDNAMEETRLYLNKNLTKLVLDAIENRPIVVDNIDINNIPTMNKDVSDFGFFMYKKHTEEGRFIKRSSDSHTNGVSYINATHRILDTKNRINYNFPITSEVTNYLKKQQDDE